MQLRIVRIFVLIAFIGWWAYNWWTLLTQGSYWTGTAFAIPVICVVVLFNIFRPSLNHRPRSEEDNIPYYTMIVVAIIVGVINHYLMSTISGTSIF